MLTRAKIIKTIKNEKPHLAAEFNVKKIGLFGSFAKGKQTGKSDKDIFIEFSKPIGFKFLELCNYLEKKLGGKRAINCFYGCVLKLPDVAGKGLPARSLKFRL